MTENRDYLELSFRSINCFANDGKLDAEELRELVDIALRDNIIDNNEIRVLNNIIGRLKEEEMDADMQDALRELAEKIQQ